MKYTRLGKTKAFIDEISSVMGNSHNSINQKLKFMLLEYPVVAD